MQVEVGAMNDKLLFVVVVLAGVVVPGLANGLFADLGYPTVGTVVWVGGYVGTAVVLWWLFIRPLEFEAGAEASVDEES